MSLSFPRMSGESELKYIYRLGSMKDNGTLDMTWGELAEIFNKELRDPTEEWSESAYRKKYALMKQFREEFEQPTAGADADELIALRRELEKEKIKIRDERNEYKKLIREEARKESYQDQFVRAICEAAGEHPLEYDEYANFRGLLNSDSSLIVPLTDIHAGLEVNNHWNSYDGDILKHRLITYLDKVFEIQERHGCEDAHVVIQEAISGIIHPNLRLQNNQDLIDQFLMVVDYICDFVATMSYRFRRINVYVAPGNHGRINPKKDQDLAHENMDNLIIPFVKARMQNFDNVFCHENTIDQGIVSFEARGLKFVSVHGDKDTPTTAASTLPKMLGFKPDVILMGHKHYNMYTSDHDTKVIQSGSLVGPDEYAVSMRLTGKPEQTVLVITNKDGLDCIYDVQL